MSQMCLCQRRHLNPSSVADGIAPGPADDLDRPEVGAFLTGRAERSPTLRFSDDQDRVGQKENILSLNTRIRETKS